LAVKVTSGITFTFGGLAIDPEDAGVLKEDGTKIEGLHCAGEMVGGLFYGNYPGGSGLTAGGVFGRRAAKAALRKWRTAKDGKLSKI
jgi:succinate dehydrogenase/fumarate reductase flavoprotein subunit